MARKTEKGVVLWRKKNKNEKKKKKSEKPFARLQGKTHV